MKLLIKRKTVVPINIELFHDKNLSLKSKGLMVLILAWNSDDSLSIENLVKKSKESTSAIKTALNELVSLGYIEKKQERENGRFGNASIVVKEFVFSPELEEEIQPTENTPTVNESSIVPTINKNIIIKNNNNTNSTENTKKKGNVSFVNSLNAKNKLKKQSSVEDSIAETLTPTQKRYLLATISNIQAQGTNISNPKELFAEAEFCIVNPCQLQGVKSFKHRVNIISKILRSNRWVTPKGFSKFSEKGVAIREANLDKKKFYYEQKASEGIQIHRELAEKEGIATVVDINERHAKASLSRLQTELSGERRYLQRVQKEFSNGKPWVSEQLILSIEKKIQFLKTEVSGQKELIKNTAAHQYMAHN